MRGCSRPTQSCEWALPATKNYILAHLHESDLDLDTIAGAINVAPRTLNRVFAAESMTPIRWLWQKRLESSKADIRAHSA